MAKRNRADAVIKCESKTTMEELKNFISYQEEGCEEDTCAFDVAVLQQEVCR